MLEEGLVSQIELPQDLSVNGKNMMRAMASILQFDTTGQEMKTWRKREVRTSLLLMIILKFHFTEKHSWSV